MGFAFYEYILLIILVILSGILGTFAGKSIIYKIPDRFLKLGISENIVRTCLYSLLQPNVFDPKFQ